MLQESYKNVKKIFGILIFIFASSLASCAPVAETADYVVAHADGALGMYYFGSANCRDCIDLKNSLLIPLSREFEGQINLRFHDIDYPESFAFLSKMEEIYGVVNSNPITLFFPDTVLLGYWEIRENARDIVLEFLLDPSRARNIEVEALADEDMEAILIERFNRELTLGFLISAALVDSINPCAISVMIFLVSVLAAQKRRRSEIVIIGVLFTATVFLTYLALLLGMFSALTFLSSFAWLQPVIKWTAIIFAAGLGVIAYTDAFRFGKSGNTKDITLQLPKSLKKLTHTIITKYMSGKRLVVGTVIAAFLATLVDSICTAEVALPLLLVMNRSGIMTTAQILPYLILYCLIFVLPLIAIMTAAYFGITWTTLASMTQKKLVFIKILFGTLMLAMAFALAFVL
ncbi:MAG: hypothetical protein FWE23_00170 [Chitinivibrionia bacterium]|nr:hypothetical protein [Chitinivibrionia bacterium]